MRCCRSRAGLRVGLTTFDAKDPDTSFPPITPLRPPEGAPNVLVVLLDDTGFGAASTFGGPVNTPTFERLAQGGLRYTRFHTTALCSPTRAALLSGRNHHTVGMGGHHRARHVGARVQLAAPEHVRAAGGDPEAERVRHRAVRQVPRGAGLGDEPDGSVRQLADRGWRVRALLRLPRWRDQSVRPGAVPRHGAGRAGPDPGGGLPLHRGHDRPRDRLGASAEGADAGQAVLRLLRAGRHPRAAPRPDGVVGPVPRQVRPRVGRAAGADPRPAEGARRRAAGRGPDRPAGGGPGLGRHARRPQAGAGAADGGVRGFPRAHRPPSRPAGRRACRAGDPRRHADLRDHRRQRRLGRGDGERDLQRDDLPQRGGGPRDTGVHGRPDRQVRHRRRPTTTTRSGGRTPWTRRTSGPSRWPRTGAAPATGRSCTGRAASRPAARCATSSTTSSTSRRPSWRWPACPSR